MKTRIPSGLIALFASCFLVGTADVGAQTLQASDPAAPNIEAAARKIVEQLDRGDYDGVAAMLRAGGQPLARPDAALADRRARGHLSGRQTTRIYVEPLQSSVITGVEPGSRPRPFEVVFESQAEIPGPMRRGGSVPGRFYQESLRGLLLPSGELMFQVYSGASVINSSRAASTAPAVPRH